ncbi:MAG: hypothetical protein ACOZAM_09275 [Pseudomonadota bacterium]
MLLLQVPYLNSCYIPKQDKSGKPNPLERGFPNVFTRSRVLSLSGKDVWTAESGPKHSDIYHDAEAALRDCNKRLSLGRESPFHSELFGLGVIGIGPNTIPDLAE